MEDKKITVCSKCLTASCWHGKFMCDGSRGAGTLKKSVSELRQLNLEHPENWELAVKEYGD